MKAELIIKILSSNPPTVTDPDAELIFAEKQILEDFYLEERNVHLRDFTTCDINAKTRWLLERAQTIEV